MNNISTIHFDDIYDFCIAIDDEFHGYYYAMNENSSVYITVIAKYAKSREIINYFTTEEGFELVNVNFHDPEFSGYEDEYIVTFCCRLNNNDSKEIWCEPAKNEKGYLISEGDVVYIFDECNSAMIPQVQGDKTFIVELKDEDEEDDEFSDDLEIGTYHYNEDCENCHEYDKDDDYVTIKLNKDDVEMLHKLWNIFGI